MRERDDLAECGPNPRGGNVNLLRPGTQARPLPADYRPVMAQVGWLGHKDGAVYALSDQPLNGREPGVFSPLYIQIGTWEELDNGRWGIRD